MKWVVVGIGLLLIFLYLILSYLGKRHAIKSSVRYADMMEVNARYSFYDIPEVVTYHDTLNSKPQFDRYNHEKKVLDYVESRIEYFTSLIEKVGDNRRKWKYYSLEMGKVSEYLTSEQTLDTKIPFHFIHKAEVILCEGEFLTKPFVQPSLRYQISYTSPKGRNSYRDSKLFTIGAIRGLLEGVSQRDSHKSFAEKQRALLTPGMRYDVLNRDGHKCLICGRTPARHNVELHVDHIKPVSKGGRTIMSNLRALCRDCNLGKSDKYIPDGVN